MYYKVVRDSFNGEYSSCIVQGVNKVIYKPNEWVVPAIPYSKLFVFDNLENAKKFWLYYEYTSHLWECEVENPVYVDAVMVGMELNTTPAILDFWKNKCNSIGILLSAPLDGTVCVDCVKLTKQIC